VKRQLRVLLLAAGTLFVSPAFALPILNPGFEDGATGWDFSPNAFITGFSPAVASGVFAAVINTNGTVIQTPVSLPGPGTYNFGVQARFALDPAINPQGLFSQAQVSFGVNGVGFASAGTDPNALRDTFAIDGPFNFSSWVTLSGIFDYAGPATTAGLLNLNLQGSRLGVVVSYDNAFVTAVPEPGTLSLLGAGLFALGLIRLRRRVA
jgi:hypothetical protein